MDALEELTEAQAVWNHYRATMRRLITLMSVCWLAAIPIILYVPIMLVVSAPAAVVSGIVAWWTWHDSHHGPYSTKKDRWGDLVQEYRPRIPGPRERLLAAETAYRKAMQ
jgi:hypothetical protein